MLAQSPVAWQGPIISLQQHKAAHSHSLQRFKRADAAVLGHGIQHQQRDCFLLSSLLCMRQPPPGRHQQKPRQPGASSASGAPCLPSPGLDNSCAPCMTPPPGSAGTSTAMRHCGCKPGTHLHCSSIAGSWSGSSSVQKGLAAQLQTCRKREDASLRHGVTVQGQGSTAAQPTDPPSQCCPQCTPQAWCRWSAQTSRG